MNAETGTAGVRQQQQNFLGHPRMLWVLLAVAVGFNFAFYGFRAFLAPYVQGAVFGYLPHDQAIQHADLLFNSFGVLLYACPIIGGWVADNVLGKVQSLRISLWLVIIGLLAMALPGELAFTMGLAFFIVASALNIPMTVLVGMNYLNKNDPKRDAGYTLYYMAINLGAVIAPYVCATWVAASYGYRWAFIAAAAGQALVALIFEIWHRRMPDADEKPARRHGYSVPLVIACCVILSYPCSLLLRHPFIIQIIVYALIVALILYFAVVSLRRRDRVQSHRYLAFLILFIALVVYWAWAVLSGSALNFFARDYVSAPFNFTLFQSFNPFFILIFAIPLAVLWPWLDKRRINPSTPRKFGIGLMLIALGYGVLVLADLYTVGGGGRIGWWSLLVYYLLSTLGELALSPIGYAVVGKLVDPRDASLAMGGWFAGVAVSYAIAGQLAAMTTSGQNPGIGGYTHVFVLLFWVGLGVGVVYLIASPWIGKLMHGVR
ncbi:MAG: peptide MFS transporter [Gammaproteobacteria bacterium]